ncbi:MAG: energy-coupling factor transporter transmembrane protein EcfT [Oscillospiraceae bacterium]|nr:energy-coupling factor transporter transmembrane protein EcfT [Oscillospiraceae bacterium]
MLRLDPATALIALTGGVLFCAAVGCARLRLNLVCAALVTVTALVNPLFNHNGVTVLFVLNDNPVTAEAFWFGAVSGVSVVAVIYWFRAFSALFTSDKLLYILGLFSPKISLILSMALRYVPLFIRQSDRIAQAQLAGGLASEDGLWDRIRGRARVFSVMVTWTLENGIVTADSMEARGYGSGRRTFFSVWRWRARDTALTAVSLSLAAASVAGVRLTDGFTFYPRAAAPGGGALTAALYAAQAVLSFTPIFLEMRERLKWRSLRSGI